MRQPSDRPIQIALVSADDVDRVNPGLALSALIHEWKLLLAAVLVGGILGFGGSFLLTPRYDSEVTLIHVRSSELQGGLQSIVGSLGTVGALAGFSGAPIEGLEAEDLEVLKSEGLLRLFIENRRLLPVLFESRWDPQRQEWKANLFSSAPDMTDAVRYFNDRVMRVTDDKVSGIIRLRIRWKDPKLAAEWANGLVDLVNADLRERALADSQRNIAYLNKQLASTTSVELRDGLSRLMAVEMHAAMLASVRMEYAFRVIDPARPLSADHYSVPRRSLIAAASSIFALMLAAFLVIIKPTRSDSS